ncbi:MAG: ATP-binding cassette domain-containing protein [Leptospirillia bacterium]
MIEAVNLKKIYRSRRGERIAVDGISFSVREGEFFSFLGPNGAGKTTTIQMMVALLAPTSGEIMIDRLNVGMYPHQVRQRIGIIFQDPSLDDRLTAWENLEFHGRLYGIDARTREKRSRFLLDVMGILERRHDLVRTFSGGMKRRLEIARGLLHSPRLLILDEPTLGLDPHSRRSVWDYIHRVRKEVGMTVFLTTHYLEEADSSDRVAIMSSGKIVAEGTPDRLKKDLSSEMLSVETANPESLLTYLLTQYPSLKNQIRKEGEGTLFFPLPPGCDLSPWDLLRSIPLPIREASVRRPNLDDVFIYHTGRDLKSENTEKRTKR